MVLKNVRIQTLFARLLLALALLAPLLGAGPAQAAGDRSGAVYVQTNNPAGNTVLMFERAADGSLTPAGEFSTGGTGTGAGLGSQGAVILSDNHAWVFAVNAGSNDVSVFKVRANGHLALVDRKPSGGVMPISLTFNRPYLYVLNAGESGSISGFKFGLTGQLTPLPGSTRPLSNGGSGPSPAPAQISFSRDGRTLVVTEKDTNLIDTYPVGEDGIASGPTVHPSAGMTPFGFEFTRNNLLIVSEAFGGAADASAVSSYRAGGDQLETLTPSALTHQTAACWVVVTRDLSYAYTTNTGSGSITGYAIGADGQISLLDEDGRTGVTGDGSMPIDMALSATSRYLYALGAGSHQLHIFQVQEDGSLMAQGAVDVPAGTVGAAAW